MDTTTTTIHRHYRAERAHGWPAQQSLEHARIRTLWEAASTAGLVRIDIEPDDDCEPDADFEAALAAQDGAYGMVVFARCERCAGWREIDSVWGFVGTSYAHSGYDTDLMRQAITAAFSPIH